MGGRVWRHAVGGKRQRNKEGENGMKPLTWEMKQEYQDVILQACGASSLRVGAKIQTLWSGYGEIVRLHLEGCNRPSVVVKHVKFPEEAEHPGGLNTDHSHRRKVRSYQMLIVLEDLDVAGYDQRRTSVKDTEIRACLSWLAHFHALFLGVAPEGLWPVGTYWHLETRPDELEAMDDAELKAAASDIDRILNESRFKTIVHGDAKLANFCFSQSGQEAAAVDFQYVGGSCGMKDVVYFLGSCMAEKECERRTQSLLHYYFSELKLAVKKDVDFAVLEKEWREMFAFAWTDYHRFLLGWMPGSWKINRYSKQLTKEVLRKLKL
ncbi:Hypothetical protein SMAX5B_018104 [Scophthalmus maximus]|uniref:CHK kinase-like domain-containing protein n=1 Tax=Scophthalmus maximus TaxID=52904 RepID=A0A2U9CJ01_SCOMX|nr:Hypothetical protein SMAX5B_018104 [Scophthalmus maximus]